MVNPVALVVLEGEVPLLLMDRCNVTTPGSKVLLLVSVQSTEKIHLFIYSRCLPISLLPFSTSALI